MFKTEAATTPELLALAKTIQATLNKHLISLKNPMCNSAGCMHFILFLLAFSRFN